ncbi:NADH:flavin oxidoreductase/NADH oxidase [Williamsia sp. CHRR-6]|uniref:NADH:flavin oxidoreductase/NADH oxidase n=1 Tax=Williamsia sp. CHRR-6 TaxID=2835871 RepID=UPI001BDB2942|nr:NADH:flavin oxidoreductase/NADH oxidase [Williamsia sp. CHRR-6]MBT0565549.1 NADH:flavin oxidoreductase/NADH oxidase [Williamsia sp. CHRR-6]
MTKPHLFEPITIRDLTIDNRIWLSPMCQYSCFDGDGVATDWHLAHLGSFAIGGFGLLIAEASAVRPDGRITPHDTGIWNDEQVAAWRRITDFVHAQDSAIGIQLAHAGRKASNHSPFDPRTGTVSVAEGGWSTVAPSAIAFEGFDPPRELTEPEIAELVGEFAEAARRADSAGFDVVEIHAAHGYLFHQFYSPLSNVRTDGYGGDFAGRTRLLIETVDAVRDVWPDEKPLFVRISATDWTDGGWTVADSVELATVLGEHGVDLVDVSSGGNVLADIPIGPGYQVAAAETIRRDAKIATAAVGLITEPAQAETIVSTGLADAVLLARAALREPGWPLRAAHTLGLHPDDAPYRPQYRRGAWRR